MNQNNEQRLKTRLLEEIERCLVIDHDFNTVTAAAIVLKSARVLETDSSIRLTGLTTYRNWSSHAKIDRKQLRLAEAAEYINKKLTKIRNDNSLRDDEYFEGIYDRHYFWFELTDHLTSLQPLLRDLKSFSQHFKLNSPGLDNEPWWYRFQRSFFKELVDVQVIVNVQGCPIKSICITYASELAPEKDNIIQINGLGYYVLLQSIYEDGEIEEDLITIFKR